MTNSTNNRSFISNTIAAGLAAIGASLCCIAPLVLISLGIGGAWISNLTALEPYQPVFVAITLLFLFLAFRKLYLVPQKCAPGDSCALPKVLRNQKIIFWVVTVVLVALLTFPYYGLMFFE
jgi:mercuric ion transport protein